MGTGERGTGTTAWRPDGFPARVAECGEALSEVAFLAFVRSSLVRIDPEAAAAAEGDDWWWLERTEDHCYSPGA